MNSSEKEYWASRIDNVFDKNYHSGTLQKLYRENYYQVEANILELYDKLIKKSELTTTELYQYQRFLSLRQQLAEQCGETATALNAQTTAALTKAYKDTFHTVNGLLNGSSVWGIQNQYMLNKVLNKKWCGSNFSSRIWKNTNSVAKDVESAVVSCVTRGVSKDVYVKMIKDRYNVGFFKADRLVRTELMHTINEAQRDTYRADGVSEVEWRAAEDERMCAVCGSMHGEIFKIDKAPALAHANCRCTILPVIETIDTSKMVDNSGESDIIDTGKLETGGQDVHYVGKIDRDLYKCVTEDIRTDEVIITDERIEHIEEGHPGDYVQYHGYIPLVMTMPDYIIEANKPNTAIVLKEVVEESEKFKLVLRLKVKNDPEEYKNSVISFWRIGDTTWKKTIKNKKILYKPE